jgi:hypothetical protein
MDLHGLLRRWLYLLLYVPGYKPGRLTVISLCSVAISKAHYRLPATIPFHQACDHVYVKRFQNLLYREKRGQSSVGTCSLRS